jgi:hypothetical protein
MVAYFAGKSLFNITIKAEEEKKIDEHCQNHLLSYGRIDSA